MMRRTALPARRRCRGFSSLPALSASLSDPQLLRTQCYVDGKWCGGGGLEVLDPASGAAIASVPDVGAAEAERAVRAAHAAGGAWGRSLAKDRAAVLERWFDLLVAHQDDLAQIMTAECGKPLAESRGEVAYGAAFLKWFAEEARRSGGDVIPQPADGRRLVTLKQPVGVSALITPWNFPVAMITRKVGPALAAGCTVVIKPAEETPLSALAVVELGVRAGVPAGVVNVVTASRANAPAVGTVLAEHELVRKLSFTGSTAVGKRLMAQCASTVKRVSLELGGNAPFIVFDDADIEKAVTGLVACKFRNSGQTCVSANRVYVQRGVYDAFASQLRERVEAMKAGPGVGEGVTIGPLINSAGLQKARAHVDDAVAKGAQVLCGGSLLPELGENFMAPTVLGGVTQEMSVAQEETFGPVAPLFCFDTEEEVIAMANDTPAGLAGYFYSRDVGRVFRVAEALECGMVGVNEGIISTEVAPFGGIKESGLGREGARDGLSEFQEVKYVCIGL